MLLDGVTLIATPQFTHVSRGSSVAHPNAIDFGWNGAGTQNQPLYSGIYGAESVKVARKRFTPGGQGSGSTGYVIDIQFETPNYTCYRSSMHMREESPLAIGTPLNWDSVVGTMGSTGDSTGPHDHVILAICPKGTPVEQMYNYRVEPDPYYHYLTDWSVGDNKLPWVTFDPSPPQPPNQRSQIVVDIGHMDIGGNMKKDQTYKVTEVNGAKIVMVLQGETLPQSNIGKKFTNTVRPLTLRRIDGSAYPIGSEVIRTYTILDESPSMVMISHNLFNPNKVWVNKSDGSIK